MNVELAVISEKGTKVHYPVVEEGIEWSTERRSSPGKLTFNVVNDNGVELLEGNTVELRVDGTPVFFGFIFSQNSRFLFNNFFFLCLNFSNKSVHI